MGRTSPGIFQKWAQLIWLITLLALSQMIVVTLLIFGIGFIADLLVNFSSHWQDSSTP